MQTIQVRPSRIPRWQRQNGWEVYEADGVSPVYCGPNAREDTLSYARQRAGYGRAEIQVLADARNGIETIGKDEPRPLSNFFFRSLETNVQVLKSARCSAGTWFGVGQLRLHRRLAL